MKINQNFDFVDGTFDTNTDKLICVQNKKYGSVHICVDAGGSNITIAKIKLYSGDTLHAALSVFDDAVKLGEEFVRRWNDQPKTLEG